MLVHLNNQQSTINNQQSTINNQQSINLRYNARINAGSGFSKKKSDKIRCFKFVQCRTVVIYLFCRFLRKIFHLSTSWVKKMSTSYKSIFPVNLEKNNLSCNATVRISQKQSPRGVLKKRCSENLQQIYMRTPMPKCDFNKVAKQLY